MKKPAKSAVEKPAKNSDKKNARKRSELVVLTLEDLNEVSGGRECTFGNKTGCGD